MEEWKQKIIEEYRNSQRRHGFARSAGSYSYLSILLPYGALEGP